MKHTRETIKNLINESRISPGRRINLSDQDLSGLDLHNLDLEGVDLGGANLQGADLQWTNFERASLEGANLRDADMKGAYLQGASLQGADLQGANLDFVSFALSCRTIDIEVDSRLVSQLLYHLCRMDVHNCPEWDELRNDKRVMALANQSHVIQEHEQPEIE